MPESRGESFYGGRFYERTFDPDPRRGNDYEVAFRANDHDDSPAAYVSSMYWPDKHRPHSSLAIEHGVNFKPDGQGTLFHSQPGGHEIDAAYSTKDARHHIPTMLGVVAQHGLRTKGRIPGASEDLSPHSARMVQRAVDLGLTKNPMGEGVKKVESSNLTDWSDGSDDARWRSHQVSRGGNEIPFGTVNQGRQFARNALRRPRQPRAVDQLTID